MSKVMVYNPADEDFNNGEGVYFWFNGEKFTLEPNADNEIKSRWSHISPDLMLAAVMPQLEGVGVRVLSGAADVDKRIRDAAEEAHSNVLRELHSAVIEKHEQEVEKSKKHGLVPPREPHAVRVARAKLKEWELLAKALVLCLFLTAPVHAQSLSANYTVTKTTADASNFQFCQLRGQSGSPFGSAIPGQGRLTTTGSSTTVDASVTTAFTQLSVAAGRGAVLVVSTDGGVTYTTHRVSSITDGDTVVVSSAVNWAAPGFIWGYYDEFCGITNADGWIASQAGDLLTFQYDSGTGTVEVIWQCRGSAMGALPVQVYPDNTTGAATRSYTAAGADSRTTFAVTLDARFSFCRVGWKGSGQVVTAYLSRLR